MKQPPQNERILFTQLPELLFVSHLGSELLGCTLAAFGVALLINPVGLFISLHFGCVGALFSLCCLVGAVVLFSEQGRLKGLEKYNMYLPAWFMAIRLYPDLGAHQH